MAVDGVQSDSVKGFKGAVTGLPLSDVIQLKGHNMFTGCIFVEFGEKRGVIYFQDGEIVHAEQNGLSGEQAFYEIIKWPGGRFDIEAKFVAENHTISKRLTHLLLEAHRLMDEDGMVDNNPAEEIGPQTDATKGRMTVNDLCRRLLGIPGVSQAVMFDRDGRAIENGHPEANALAAFGSKLASKGSRLGELFGIGSLKAVAIHDKQRQLLQFEVRNLFLTLAVNGDESLSQVEAELRKNFAAKR